MSGKRRRNWEDMTITEQLESIKESCCGLCKYKEALECGELIYPETTTANVYFEEHFCERCKIHAL